MRRKDLCFECGKIMILNEKGELKTRWGDFEVIIRGVGTYECVCGEREYTIEDVGKAHQLITGILKIGKEESNKAMGCPSWL